MIRNTIPNFAADYPVTATDISHLRLTFYCINCMRKRETTYLTPNFGPFCDACIAELKTAWVEK